MRKGPSKPPKTKEEWAARIKVLCKNNGCYKLTDNAIINELAEIQEKRCIAEREFEQTGGHTVITNAGTIPRRNPILQTWIDLTKAALPYWQELGLTPMQRKKLENGTDKNGEPKPDFLTQALRVIS